MKLTDQELEEGEILGGAKRAPRLNFVAYLPMMRI